VRAVRMTLFAAFIAAIMLTPEAAVAQSATPSSVSTRTYSATQSVAATATYDLNFTLPTAGKSGCMVCHGDPNLVRIRDGQAVSMWVDAATLEQSIHATVQCTGCHLDFAYSVPHINTLNDAWRDVAKLACKNCHKEAFTAYSRGVHTLSPKPGQTPTATLAADKKLPLCGDCHGSHDIQKLTNNPAGQEELHKRGKQVCGDCHLEFWDNYNDSYHGSAYKRGAPDAPACWQCHGAHDILPSSDRRSLTNEVNLVDTCSRCHTNQPNEEYVSYSTLVHNRQEIYEANPVVAFWQDAVAVVRSWFGQ
jgi:hypothetical protein